MKNRFYLNSLKDDTAILKKPIPVAFSWEHATGPDSYEYVLMRLENAHVFSSGDNLDEAISFLQSMIVENAKMLAKFPVDRCGKTMAETKKYLEENVELYDTH